MWWNSLLILSNFPLQKKMKLFSLHNFHPAFMFARWRIFNNEIYVMALYWCWWNEKISSTAHSRRERQKRGWKKLDMKKFPTGKGKKLSQKLYMSVFETLTQRKIIMEVTWWKRRIFSSTEKNYTDQYSKNFSLLCLFPEEWKANKVFRLWFEKFCADKAFFFTFPP